jgi:hypothetical protein
MLHPHSLLWHYLWLGPSFLLLGLALLCWRRGLHRVFPAFFTYLFFEGIQNLTLWVLDVAPRITPEVYWRSVLVGLGIESLVKLFVIWELFSHLVRQRPETDQLGTRLIACTGAILSILAVIATAHAYIGPFAIMWYCQAFEQAIYLVEAGFLLFLFLFAAYFHLVWERRLFGIALWLSISACVGLAIFALSANGIQIERYYLLDFFNMSVYQVCVLMWWYYLLSPTRPAQKASIIMDSSVITRGTSDSAPVRRLLPTQFLVPNGVN